MFDPGYVKEGVDNVSVDIYATFGKRVAARTIAVQASSSAPAGMAT